MTFAKIPPMKFITTCIAHLKNHYPHRFARIFVLNAGGPFQFLWRIIKPLLPKKALSKIFVVSRKDSNKVLDEHIGLPYIESTYIVHQ